MSSQKNQGTTVENIDEIDSFVADMASLCMNEPYSDVEFLVEDQRLPGHRLVLATRSEYFRALLYGGLAESNQREVRLDVPLEAFKLILGYLYSGKMPLSTLDVDTIIDVLDLAHLYGLQAVETGVDKYLQQSLSVSNVCTILDVARRNNLNQRAEECLNFIDNNGSDIVKHDSFAQLSKESIEELLRRDKFAALEIDIFRAVCKWRDNHPSEDFNTVAALRAASESQLEEPREGRPLKRSSTHSTRTAKRKESSARTRGRSTTRQGDQQSTNPRERGATTDAGRKRGRGAAANAGTNGGTTRQQRAGPEATSTATGANRPSGGTHSRDGAQRSAQGDDRRRREEAGERDDARHDTGGGGSRRRREDDDGSDGGHTRGTTLT
ncbi:GL25742 [Drosophila persimilis]|uniref:GL25742 n=1 Tax=Drosophila persimilis TaxID=7234 RepID=B4GK56_DROPE|nr:GL25742 [Drosophila persimilis]